jgi:biotin carboxyl carrier protein
VSSSLDAIKRVVEAFERSDWTEIDIRSGDVHVHLATRPATRPATDAATGAATGTVSHAPAAPETGGSAPDGAGDGSAPTKSDVAGTSRLLPPADAHIVVAPSPGICWRSPEPGAPHFVDTGDSVDAAATVCIIEVMKLMSHLKAGVSGRIVAVYGENGVAVQKGEALFAIAPSGSAS